MQMSTRQETGNAVTRMYYDVIFPHWHRLWARTSFNSNTPSSTGTKTENRGLWLKITIHKSWLAKYPLNLATPVTTYLLCTCYWAFKTWMSLHSHRFAAGTLGHQEQNHRCNLELHGFYNREHKIVFFTSGFYNGLLSIYTLAAPLKLRSQLKLMIREYQFLC